MRAPLLQILGVVALLGGCRAPSATSAPAANDAGSLMQDAGIFDAAISVQDASFADAAPPSRVRIFPRRGDATDDALPPVGPGLLLDSGGGAGIFPWMHRTAVGGAPGRGDVVILSPDGGDDAGSFVGQAPFRSVQAIAVPDNATEAEYREAASVVEKAEIVWFVGGDQARYVRWKGSALLDAVQRVYDRGGVIGGTSAGMIILGGAVNDALNSISEAITTEVCLANPYDGKLHFTQNLFRFPPLAGAITDPHFVARDRMGRLTTFMARQVADGIAPSFRGIAVDDGAALAIDKDGVGTRIAAGAGPSVYVVDGGAPTEASPGRPLRYSGLSVFRLTEAQHQFRFLQNCGSALRYTLNVDGGAVPPYSTDPYTSGTAAATCP